SSRTQATCSPSRASPGSSSKSSTSPSRPPRTNGSRSRTRTCWVSSSPHPPRPRNGRPASAGGSRRGLRYARFHFEGGERTGGSSSSEPEGLESGAATTEAAPSSLAEEPPVLSPPARFTSAPLRQTFERSESAALRQREGRGLGRRRMRRAALLFRPPIPTPRVPPLTQSASLPPPPKS